MPLAVLPLVALPFAAQLALLAERVARQEALAPLIAEAAGLPDPEPLGQLARLLREAGLLGRRELRAALVEALRTAPDVAVRQLLAALAGEEAAGLVEEACRGLGVERLRALGLMLRWLGRESPARWEALRDAAVAACAEAITAGEIAAIAEETLLRVPGSRRPSLDELARQRGAQAAWSARLEGLAAKVLEALSREPRTLSLAHAEELLARRVYEGEGHFLAELLQNADDAGARSFVVEVRGREVRVQHDGVPFDALDVLGVLSIGQTTKGAGSIGQFGVGFKAVHGVASRPRVFSGPYRFEIGAMGLARPLAPESPVAGLAQTLLVLPLLPAIDERRVLEQALAIPAETLLTLRSLRRLRIVGPGVERERRAEAHKGRVRLVEEDGQTNRGGGSRELLVAEGMFEGPLGRVLVAVRLDAEGLAAKLGPEEPSLYCYLPTRERTDLGILIHAPFEVPLDRERIDRSSARNARALELAGELLAQLVARVAAEGEPRQVEALLCLLPLDLPGFRGLAGRCREVLAAAPILPALGGGLLAPRAALLVEGDLGSLLAGEIFAGGRRAAGVHGEAARRVAVALGAAIFGPASLLGLLEVRLAGTAEGEPPAVGWLGKGAAIVARCLGELDAAGRKRLLQLPWLLDEAGGSWRAASLRRAGPEIRALYGVSGGWLGPGADAAAPWEALGVRELGPREVMADLRRPAELARMAQAAGWRALLAFAAGPGAAWARGLGTAACFPDEAGVAGPLEGGAARWLWPQGPLAAALGSLSPSVRPSLLDRAIDREFRPFLLGLGGRVLDVEALVALIGRGELPAPAALALLGVIDPALLSPRAREQLGRARLWPVRSGGLRPAVEVLRASALRAALGELQEGAAGVDDAEGLLRAAADRLLVPEAEEAASLLAGTLPFLDAETWLLTRAREVARLGEPLAAQEPPLDRLSRLLLLSRKGGPWGLDARGSLVADPLVAAAEDELLLARGLPLAERLAHPTWAALATLGKLPARRLVEALAARSREPDAAVFFDPERRVALYAWLLRRREEIEADELTWGALGKAALIGDEEGELRAPRELLVAEIPALEGLVAGRPEPAVPGALRAWLGRVYRLDGTALGRLVDALLVAIEAARTLGDGPLALARTQALARALSVPEGREQEGHEARVEQALRAQKAARRLRVETSAGGWERARELLVASPERAALVHTFHTTPPPQPREGLDEALLIRLGARPALEVDELRALLRGEGLLPGALARVALARYVALSALDTPALREHLALDRTAWVPDALGATHRPAELFWPAPGLPALLGEAPGLQPHPLLSRTVPAALAAWLPFRSLEQAALDEVLAPLTHSPAPELLRWLERALAQGRLQAAALRAAPADKLEILRASVSAEVEPRSPFPLLAAALRRPAPRPADEAPPTRRTPEATIAAKNRGEGGPKTSPKSVLRTTPMEAGSERPAPAGSELTPPASEASAGPGEGLWGRVKGWFSGEAKVPPAAPDPAPAGSASSVPPAPARQERGNRQGRGNHEERRRAKHEERRRAKYEALVGRAGRGSHEGHGGRDSHEGRDGRDSHDGRDGRDGHEGRLRRQSSWFRPSGQVDAQLGKTAGWSEQRRETPVFGLAFAPDRVPVPYLYAPKLIAARFDASRQRWLPAVGLTEALGGRGEAGKVRFEGRLQEGEVQLPVPLHGRPGPVSAEGATLQPTQTPEGAWMLRLPADSELHYEVSLAESPRFGEDSLAVHAPPVLLARSAPDELLPGEVHDFLSDLAAARSPLLTRALQVRDFIREQYRYDPSYLENAEISGGLAAATRSSPHAHLAALHAGRGGRHLGAGVCYELNALACELLRRVGVPAAVCTGWVLTGQQLSEPDHLWALALLPTADGPRWLPIDASATREGLPQTGPARPAGAFRAAPPAGARRLPPPPTWATSTPRPPPRSTRSGAAPQAARPAPRPAPAPHREATPPAAPPAELLQAVRRLEQLAGEEPMAESLLRRRLADLLADPDEARRLLDLLRGP